MAAFTAALFYNLISFHTLFALQLRLVRNELTRTWCCSSKDRLYFYQVWFLNVDGVWRAFSIGIFRYYVCMVDRLMEMIICKRCYAGKICTCNQQFFGEFDGTSPRGQGFKRLDRFLIWWLPSNTCYGV
ncbi:hypothetical protein SCA6_009226 [Theobroma cacao]